MNLMDDSTLACNAYLNSEHVSNKQCGEYCFCHYRKTTKNEAYEPSTCVLSLLTFVADTKNVHENVRNKIE